MPTAVVELQQVRSRKIYPSAPRLASPNSPPRWRKGEGCFGDIGHEQRVLHCLVKAIPERLDPDLGRARRTRDRPLHHQPAEHQSHDLAILFGLRVIHDERDIGDVGISLECDLDQNVDLVVGEAEAVHGGQSPLISFILFLSRGVYAHAKHAGNDDIDAFRKYCGAEWRASRTRS